MKAPRFIKEYASYIIKDLNNSLATDMCKKVITERIERNTTLLEKGYITIEDCKQDASIHAMENSRLKGEYLITKVKEVGNTGLVCADLTQKAYKGIKKGKAVLWEV